MVAQRASSSSTGQSSQMTTAPAARSRLDDAGLRVGAAAQRQHQGSRDSAARPSAASSCSAFDLAEGGFAQAFENGGNAEAGVFLDARVEIFKAPGELARQQSAHGGLARAHEAGQAHHSRDRAGARRMASECGEGVRATRRRERFLFALQRF